MGNQLVHYFKIVCCLVFGTKVSRAKAMACAASVLMSLWDHKDPNVCSHMATSHPQLSVCKKLPGVWGSGCGFRTKIRIEKVCMAIIRKIKFVCLKYVRIKYVGYKVRHVKSLQWKKNHNGKKIVRLNVCRSNVH